MLRRGKGEAEMDAWLCPCNSVQAHHRLILIQGLLMPMLLAVGLMGCPGGSTLTGLSCRHSHSLSATNHLVRMVMHCLPSLDHPGKLTAQRSDRVLICRTRPGLAMSQDAKNWARIEASHHTGALFDAGESSTEWDAAFVSGPQVRVHALCTRHEGCQKGASLCCRSCGHDAKQRAMYRHLCVSCPGCKQICGRVRCISCAVM